MRRQKHAIENIQQKHGECAEHAKIQSGQFFKRKRANSSKMQTDAFFSCFLLFVVLIVE